MTAPHDISLEGPRRDAVSGSARSLVVVLHGYGADGHDLIGLTEPLAPYMPDTVFRAPHAPDRCRVNPMGRQWFPIPWIDGSAEAEMTAGFLRATEILTAHLTAAMAEEGMTPAETALVGFSQGTMMALQVGPRLEPGLAGIVGYSGRVADEAALSAAPTRPPVFLAHGDQDEVIPVAELARTAQALDAAGYEVGAHVSPGMGHGIGPDGLGLGLRFLVEKLGITPPGPVDNTAT